MALAHKLFTSLQNYSNPATRIGELNRIWYDSVNNVFRIQLDTVTPGGTVIAGGLSYLGTWNASTNTPTLASSTGTNGGYYIVATAGSTNLNGITDWQIGDWLMYNGTVWQKIDQSNTVTSVNGQTGAVSVGTVASVGGTGTVSGISLSGTVTSSGILTLGGTLDLSSPPAIGATSPSTGTFTTLTAQTEVLKGTGQNFLLYSQNFTNAVWQTANATATNNTTIAPDGTTTAGTVTLTVSSVGFFKQNFNVTAGQVYTFSFYALRGTATDMKYSVYNNTGSAEIVAPTSYYSSTNASTWSRISVTFTAPSGCTYVAIYPSRDSASTGTFFIWGAQVELAQTAGVYLPTTTTAVYGTPTLSFSGVAGLGLQSDGSLYVSPAGTGALQAQKTDSTATGGNARGANAVDWQTTRGAASQVASGSGAVIGGGYANLSSGSQSVVAGGYNNTAAGGSQCFVGGGALNNANASFYSLVTGGKSNQANLDYSAVVGGNTNSAAGYYNFIGGGFTNSGTSNSAVTTQSGTMNGTTAVTLSGSNASIKVGHYISGTFINYGTYVSAISGTSLTLSQVAVGSGTTTLSFFTPHGVVVGGGNNQATGSYSFIGGGGDAGTASNRNVASGDWSVVGGGNKNTASAIYATVVGGISNTSAGQGSFIGGGGWYGSGVSSNTSFGTSSFVGAGYGNSCGGFAGVIVGGTSNAQTNSIGFIGGGNNNTCNALNATISGGSYGTTRSIEGNTVFPAHASPIAAALGVSQGALLILGVQTTDATATVLRSNTSAAGTTNQVILPNNSAYYFRGEIVAGVTGGGNTKGWYVEGVIKRGAGVGTTAIVGTATVTSNYADAGASTWALTATADTTNGGLAITFTGQAATTIRCVAQIRTTEMTY